MFRVTTGVSHISKILHCRRLILDYRIVPVTYYPVHYTSSVKANTPKLRDSCPQPPPPKPKPPKDDKWIWIALTALLVSGIGIVTAKSSPEIRDWMTLYAPWVDDLIAALYEENYTYGDLAMQYIDGLKSYIAEFTNDKQIKQISTDKKPVSDVPAEENEKESSEKEATCCKPAKPILTLDICEIEKCIKELGEAAIHNYNKAKEACASYNSLVDKTMQKFTIKGLKKLRLAKKERKALIKESLDTAGCAVNRLEEMYHYLDCGVQASKEEINKTKLLHRNYKQMYNAARNKFDWENDTALVKDKYWKMLETVIDKYVEEIESIYPGFKYTAKRPNIEGNADMLLYSAYRYINQLNDELDDAAALLSERVSRAYDSLPGDADKKKARERELQALYAVKKAEIAKNLAERFAAQKVDNDNLLKALTKKQLEKHEVLLEKRLKQKEEEIRVKIDKMVSAEVNAQKKIFASQLADMAMKLEVVETKLNMRLKAERETRRSQKLWAAASSLLHATKKGGTYVNINKELNAIEKAAEGEDKLVLTVLKSLSGSVREKGIVGESMLKKQYKLMEDTALKVALVEETGGFMPVYILSWLQAILLFMKISGIPQKEFEKPPKEPPEELDTFDLLQRARFWINQGNLPLALKYVNSLKGASRLAADTWYKSARAYLEVRQAAEIVLAHAVALGLQYI